MDLEKYLIGVDATFQQAMAEMDRRGKQILLVVDLNHKLCGTITDGDLRRAVLRNCSPVANVSEVYNGNPLTVAPRVSFSDVKQLMIAKSVHHIPILNEEDQVVGLHTEDFLVSSTPLPMHAVLMVGGRGTRLGLLTKTCPKPMLTMGGKPILQTIVEQLRSAGIIRIHMAVNYLASQIKEYFGDGNAFGVCIDYLEELEPLGTAGALRLLGDVGNNPILVMNGDILTKVNFAHVLEFHNLHHAVGTMCVREFGYQVPYGVVSLDGVRIKSIQEKPATRVLVNSGIYVIEPSALKLLPNSGPFQMPELFEQLRKCSLTTVAFPIVEYWKDIGSPEDFKSASIEFGDTFNG